MVPSEVQHIDIAVIGAGAAGLMASIAAGRQAQQITGNQDHGLRIVAFDGAKKIGAKILVAGGGRCNVTHHQVTPKDYAGGSRNAIKNALKRFGVKDTIAFFADLGVTLKQEDTGKLFPTTDKAQTVLSALHTAARSAGVEIRNPYRIEAIEVTGPPLGATGGLPNSAVEAEPNTHNFLISGPWGSVHAKRVILATGGKALPRSGSDGHGYKLAKHLGHTLTDRILPSLVPLVLDGSCFLRELSGLAAEARLELRSGTGKRLYDFTGSTLCTHFGLSGPAPMNISRHYTNAKMDDPNAHMTANWLPAWSAQEVDEQLLTLGKRSVSRWAKDTVLPQRLSQALCAQAGVDPATLGSSLTREGRKALVEHFCALKLPINGDRGFNYAETTAGGVPLTEVTISDMRSKVCDGLHLCGEVCDVDGRIGGFNFQWAWATGHIAGTNAAKSLADSTTTTTTTT